MDWPLDKCVIRRGLVNHTYGPVRKDSAGNVKNHQGWDFFAPIGTTVYAIADGDIVYVKEAGDYGLTMVQSFQWQGETLYAAYAHLSKSLVGTAYKNIQEGQAIALTGESGNAKQLKHPLDKHLHFEIRTVALPGRGLAGRMCPLKVFGVCPRGHAQFRKGGL